MILGSEVNVRVRVANTEGDRVAGVSYALYGVLSQASIVVMRFGFTDRLKRLIILSPAE